MENRLTYSEVQEIVMDYKKGNIEKSDMSDFILNNFGGFITRYAVEDKLYRKIFGGNDTNVGFATGTDGNYVFSNYTNVSCDLANSALIVIMEMADEYEEHEFFGFVAFLSKCFKNRFYKYIMIENGYSDSIISNKRYSKIMADFYNGVKENGEYRYDEYEHFIAWFNENNYTEKDMYIDSHEVINQYGIDINVGRNPTRVRKLNVSMETSFPFHDESLLEGEDKSGISRLSTLFLLETLTDEELKKWNEYIITVDMKPSVLNKHITDNFTVPKLNNKGEISYYKNGQMKMTPVKPIRWKEERAIWFNEIREKYPNLLKDYLK